MCLQGAYSLSPHDTLHGLHQALARRPPQPHTPLWELQGSLTTPCRRCGAQYVERIQVGQADTPSPSRWQCAAHHDMLHLQLDDHGPCTILASHSSNVLQKVLGGVPCMSGGGPRAPSCCTVCTPAFDCSFEDLNVCYRPEIRRPKLIPTSWRSSWDPLQESAETNISRCQGNGRTGCNACNSG